ncbi:MAG: chemotaxis protein CheW, partial [Promethearchaeota archaeon]
MSLKEINLISEIPIVRFQIDSVNFGLDVYQIRDIIRVTDITRVPNSQDFILGVINLRGMIIPVVNLRKRLSFDNENYPGDIRILITEYGEEWAGLMVDSVSDVINLPSTNIEPRPRYLVNNIDANFLIGLGLDITQKNNHSSFQGVKSTSESEMILLLDLGKVLNIKDHLKERSSIKKIIERKSVMLAEEREKIKENILRLKDSTKDSILESIKSKVSLQKVKNKDQEEMFKKKQEEIISKIKLSQKSNLSLGLSDQIQGLKGSKTGEIMPLDASRGLSGKGKKIVRRVVVRRKSHKKPSIVNESDQISFGKIKLEEIPLKKTQELETSEESKEENPFLTMNEMQKSLIQEIGNIGAGN